MIWLNLNAVIKIHKQIMDSCGSPYSVPNIEKLASALDRPLKHYECGEPNLDVIDFASIYLDSIVANHPFFDGNKRAAVSSCELFLILNNEEEIKLVGDEEFKEIVIKLAAHEIEREFFLDIIPQKHDASL